MVSASATRSAYGRVARGYLTSLESRGIDDLDPADGASVLGFRQSLTDRWAAPSLFGVVSNFRPSVVSPAGPTWSRGWPGRGETLPADPAGVRRRGPVRVVHTCTTGSDDADAATTLLALTTGLACHLIGLGQGDIDWRGRHAGDRPEKTGNPLTLRWRRW